MGYEDSAALFSMAVAAL